MTPILLSIKPRFADLIFKGLKEAELRRRFLRNAKNREVFVYVTSPVRELRGGFRVKHVWQGTPDDVWAKVRQLARVDKKDFDAYYADRKVAYALEIDNVWQSNNPVSFQILKRRFPDFVAPQSWRYVRQEEDEFLRVLREDRTGVQRDSDQMEFQRPRIRM